jgi:hypothetical protein
MREEGSSWIGNEKHAHRAVLHRTRGSIPALHYLRVGERFRYERLARHQEDQP